MSKTVKVKRTERETGKETVYDSIKLAAIRNRVNDRTVRRWLAAGVSGAGVYKWERVNE